MQIAEFIAPFLVELIGSLIIEEVKYLWGIKENISSLRLKLRYLRSFLRDVNEKHDKQEVSGNNQLMKTHVKEITRLACEIENLNNVYASVLNERSLIRWILRPCTLVEIHRIGVEVDRIHRRVQEAVGMLNDLGNSGCISEDSEEEGNSANIRSRL